LLVTQSARVLLGAAVAVLGMGCGAGTARTPTVVVSRAAREGMNAAFDRSNEHWDELADLNTMERMLGTIRPTQREFLGCLQGQAGTGTLRIEGWTPAADMKQLQLAVAGNCDSVPRLVGTWHTHPFRADLQNRPIKERGLSPQDLETFAATRLAATLVMWDRDSVDAAVRDPRGQVIHPAVVRLE
jgi:hypothetical protein